MAQASLSYSFIPCSCVDGGGKACTVSLCCWELGEVVWWELRIPAKHLLPSRASLDLHRLSQRDLQGWKEAVVASGCDLDEHLAASRKSQGSRGEELQDINQQEWAMTTFALLTLMLWWSTSRRRVVEKGMGEALLHGILLATLHGDVATDPMWGLLDPAFLQHCRHGALGQGPCCHYTAAREHMLLQEGAVSQLRCAQWLLTVHKAGLECPMLAMWGAHLCKGLAAEVDRGVRAGDWSSDALKDATHLGGPKKKLRISEAYRQATNTAVAEGRAISRTRVLKLGGDVCESSARSWDNHDAQVLLASGWQSFGKVSNLTLAPDASRLGNPAEDTEMFPAWTSDGNIAMWLCPQATSCSKITIAPSLIPLLKALSCVLAGLLFARALVVEDLCVKALRLDIGLGL